jgi:pimeloyl-ACP methyl ester carboxylesterase
VTPNEDARRQRGRWFTRPWGRMRVWEAGPFGGRPLLAIHGLGGSGRYWQGLADRVGDRYRVLAPDLAGFGSSEEPASEADRVMHLLDLDELVADTFGDAPSRPMAVVGHSLGGILATLWSARRPERCAALALAAPPWPSGRSMDVRSRGDRTTSRTRASIARGLRTIWPVIAVPVGAVRGYPAATVIDFGRQSVRSRTWALWSLWSDPALQPELEDAAEVLDGHVPVLIVHAHDDRTVRIAAHAPWVQLFPSARGEVIARGSHQFLLRDGFEPLASWLESLPAP